MKITAFYLTKKKKKFKITFSQLLKVDKAEKEMLFKMFIGLWKQQVIYWICSALLISTNASRESSCLLSPMLTYHKKNSLEKIDFNSSLAVKHLPLVKEAHNLVLCNIWTASALGQRVFSLLLKMTGPLLYSCNNATTKGWWGHDCHYG